MAKESFDPISAYIMAEYDKLNKELESILKEIRSRERYSLTIVAVVAVWFFDHIGTVDKSLLIPISFIPLVTTILYGLSVKFLSTNINWIREYLFKIEHHVLPGNPNGFGWEKHFAKKNEERPYLKISIIIWIVQLALSAILITSAFSSDFIKAKIKKEAPKTEKAFLP